MKAYDFANVKPCDNKAKIIHCLKVKFADAVVNSKAYGYINN